MFEDTISFIQRRFARKEQALYLSIFRILFFSVTFGEVCQIVYFKDFIYEANPHFSYEFFNVFLYLWVLTSIFLIVGYQTRIAAILSYVFLIMFFRAFASLFEYHFPLLAVRPMAGI